MIELTLIWNSYLNLYNITNLVIVCCAYSTHAPVHQRSSLLIDEFIPAIEWTLYCIVIFWNEIGWSPLNKDQWKYQTASASFHCLFFEIRLVANPPLYLGRDSKWRWWALVLQLILTYHIVISSSSKFIVFFKDNKMWRESVLKKASASVFSFFSPYQPENKLVNEGEDFHRILLFNCCYCESFSFKTARYASELYVVKHFFADLRLASIYFLSENKIHKKIDGFALHDGQLIYL
jgi:hypothetical protein